MTSVLVSRSLPPLVKPVLKAVVFSIAGYRLALPMESVLRVVNAPPEMSASSAPQERSGMVELIHLGHLAIAVLNLYPHLSLKQSISRSVGASQGESQQGQFLVVTKVGGEICAIRVDTPPDLIELDASTIRQIPAPYQQNHPLSIASRVAVLPQGKATLAIFVLDMERVLRVIKD
ncbi:chemotaxis protein CheW [Myxacorys almedinensis]|uniref:CheW-like domain-containing protein n=1 Tax=Myxacorys almedinensis A TaxID=2690445 RepID=A0A8J8CNL0_9CYAN|nr:chemotaxis protein CheW [Myxacorys almedinensis]NDJ19685.1 hypothetical protein [Myxacorys almedinensis A]